MSENLHAQSLKHVSHDVTVDAGYFAFCDCKVASTESDKSNSTHFSVLVDWSDHVVLGLHVTGVEFLTFPDDAVKTVEDLNQFGITETQKQLIIDEVVAWVNFNE